MKKIVLTVTCIIVVLLIITSCAKQIDKPASSVRTITFEMGEYYLPFLTVKINNKSYTTNKDGKLLVSDECKSVEVAAPFRILKNERSDQETRYFLEFDEKKKYFGAVLLKKKTETSCLYKVLSIEMPEVKAVEVSVPKQMNNTSRNKLEKEVFFSDNAYLFNLSRDVKILEMKMDKEDKIKYMYAILGQANGTVEYFGISINNESMNNLDQIVIKVVDGDGIEIK